MGSPCEIQLFAASPDSARQAVDAAVAEVARLESRYSRYRDDSILSAINRVAAAGGEVELDDETAGLIDYADACHRQSDGLFDISSGILRRVWNFREGRLPDPQDVRGLLPLVGWDKVAWRRPALGFPRPGMEIDLGGVVKEYAADSVARLCREAGIRHGVVNLGGDIRVIGPRPGGEGWNVGIRHPRAADAAVATLTLDRGGVATSGDYERCIDIGGVRYGHILNPLTGWPVRHLASVTVVADFCVVAGSASTIAILKERDGPAWLDGLGSPHLWIDTRGQSGGTLLAGIGG
ncbi:MAG: FAD:protein FMN transferase [Alphaproteobacteria bacterium]|nr:FAD:protein FMN transferase [Alphaproteobacteria bacterium]